MENQIRHVITSRIQIEEVEVDQEDDVFHWSKPVVNRVYQMILSKRMNI